MNVCAERILHRRVNVDTGSVTNIMEEDIGIEKVLALHPKDNEPVLQAEVTTCILRIITPATPLHTHRYYS